MILVDSSVWIDHFRDTVGPEVALLRQLVARGGFDLVVGDLILFEVLSGVTDRRTELLVRTGFLVARQVEIAGLGAVDDAAALYRQLRRRGITPGPVDTYIAAWCLRQPCPLLTRDRDFLPMRNHLGLELADPARFDPDA